MLYKHVVKFISGRLAENTSEERTWKLRLRERYSRGNASRKMIVLAYRALEAIEKLRFQNRSRGYDERTS